MVGIATVEPAPTGPTTARRIQTLGPTRGSSRAPTHTEPSPAASATTCRRRPPRRLPRRSSTSTLSEELSCHRKPPTPAHRRPGPRRLRRLIELERRHRDPPGGGRPGDRGGESLARHLPRLRLRRQLHEAHDHFTGQHVPLVGGLHQIVRGGRFRDRSATDTRRSAPARRSTCPASPAYGAVTQAELSDSPPSYTARIR
jgi:hypothetical protein